MEQLILADSDGRITHDFDEGPYVYNGIAISLDYTLNTRPVNQDSASIVVAPTIEKHGYRNDIQYLMEGLIAGNVFVDVYPMLTLLIDYPDGSWRLISANKYKYDCYTGRGSIVFCGEYLEYNNNCLTMKIDHLINDVIIAQDIK